MEAERVDEDALVNVLGRLPPAEALRLGLVCRQWYAASLRAVKLSTLNFSPFLPLRDAEAALATVRHRGTHAVHVNLGYVRLTSQVPLTAFVTHFSPALKTLDVSAVTSKKWINDEAIEALTAQCPQLARINIFGCWTVTDEGVRAIAARCKELQVLNLGSCTAVTDEGVLAIGRSCPQLVELNLWRLEFVTDRSLAVVAEKCTSMATLVVSDCKNVSPQGLTKFSALCKVYF